MTTTPPTASAPTMEPRDKQKLRAAAVHAARVLPGALGSLLAREFLAAEEFGYASRDNLALRAATDILTLRRDDVAPLLAPRDASKPAIRVKVASA